MTRMTLRWLITGPVGTSLNIILYPLYLYALAIFLTVNWIETHLAKARTWIWEEHAK